MIRQELRHSRWLVLGTLMILLGVILAGIFSDQSANPAFQAELTEAKQNYPAYLWSLLFNPLNGLGPLFVVLAAFMGASLIAGEVARGTLFTLLARPLTRDRLLLTKYAVGAGLLLALIVAATLMLLAAAALAGQPQALGGALLSALLLWLGTLFVFGVAALGSVLVGNITLPLVIALVTVALLTLLPPPLRLPLYWTSLPTFTGEVFPARQLLINLIAAALPLIAALLIFRRQQY